MTYEEIRMLMQKPKLERYKKRMNVINFGRFSVMESDKTDAIIIDNDIADMISDRRWCIDASGYPVANFGTGVIRLFDIVMAVDNIEKPDGCYVDHINHDKLDNRRINLRFVTPLDSSRNMPLRSDNSTGVTGISKTKHGTYRAYITFNGKQVNLGRYKTIEEAITARAEGECRFGFTPKAKTISDLCAMRKGL